jgi:surfactin synthase thioesterase subunit
MTAGGRWLVWSGQPEATAPATIFCIPHAGGGAGSFRPWLDVAPDDVRLALVRLPGRENRFTEPPIDDMRRLVGELADVVTAQSSARVGILGHCSGALVAYETARELARRRAPVHRLFVSGRAAPDAEITEPPISRLPDAVLTRRLQELQATPTIVLDREEMLPLVLPAIRADFGLAERYSWFPGEPIRCGIDALAGSHDPWTSIDELRQWARHATAGFRLRTYAGGRGFLLDRAADVVRDIAAAMRR